MPQWAQITVALIAAIGGMSGLLQFVRSLRAWRDGVRQREDAAEERHVRRLEKRNEQLERRIDENAAYEAVLMTALAQNGVAIPPRPKPNPEGA